MAEQIVNKDKRKQRGECFTKNYLISTTYSAPYSTLDLVARPCSCSRQDRPCCGVRSCVGWVFSSSV